MFNQLSDQTVVLTTLQSLSDSDLVLATDNLIKIISSLHVDVKNLLANKRNHGAILRTETLDSSIIHPVENTLSVLITSEQHLTNAINTLCLTEAILVRDTFENTLQIIADLETKNERVTKKEIATPIAPIDTASINNKKLLKNTPQTKNVSVNNIAPIHLNDVKQRLTQALRSSADQHANIKNKLNGLLSTQNPSPLTKKAV